MDDLDHSMCISDHDWLSFFEETEECCLLQASLACPDSSGLSDGDDLDFATCTDTPSNAEQAGEESKERQVVGEEFSSVVCSSAEESQVSVNPNPKPELPVTNDATSCAEKERWFVTVNDNPTKYRKAASGSVVTKKRKRKKIGKDKHKDGEGHTCGNTDMTMPLKVPEELFSDSLGTEVNITHFEAPCKGNRLQHLDVGNIRTKPRKTVKSGTCADVKQLISPDTEPIQDASSESHFTEPSMDLTCHGVYGDSAVKIKLDSGFDITKLTETSATVFIQEKDSDLGCESSQTKLTMDSGVGVYFDTIESTKSPDFKLDITNDSNLGHIRGENRYERIVKELDMDLTCLEDSYDKMPQSAMDSLDSVSGNYAESVDAAKPIDNPFIHTNSIESDDFADVEVFSSFSNDSEMYHSAAESMEDSCHPSMQNSPCNVSISINDGLEDIGMHSCLQRDSSRPHIETSQIFPSAYPGADNTPNDNSTCSDCTESTALSMSVDTPTSASNSSSSLGGQPESLPQCEVTMESPEAFAKATGSNQPVYAISAFWDEMEKLTINDILHIRMGRCMLPVEEAPNANELMSTSYDIKSSATIIPESADLDTMDTTDSDYCTNLDESKPDCSSCDFSTSDFEEEYWQFINSSRNSSPDLHDKSYQSQCTDCVSASEEEADEIGTPVPLEDRSGQKWSCESTLDSFDVAVPHQMRKTKSMYDVHALKTMEALSPQAFLDQSSCKSLEEPFNMNCMFEVATPIMCHADEQYQISFPKVFEYLFEDSKSKSEAMSVSVYGRQRNPVLPVNSYTFHATMNDQSVRNYREEPIPIFSCSRPTVRELTFPKPGCVFLGTNYTAIKDISPIQILSQSIVRGMDCRQTDRAFCFSQDLSSLYLVKSICFLDKGSDVWRYQSEDDEKSVDVTDSSISVVGEGGVSTMTPQMFQEAALRQISMEKNHIPSDYAQGIFSTIKQSDMCLVCIAFASWVLKSSDPEAADSWKAALLANVSALSAIQYLRQYMKKKASPQHD